MHAFEKTPPEVEELLRRPIKELGLKLEGSSVEKYVQQLYRELGKKGLQRFRPACYLTDEWGCPSGEPIIGIPFDLADPKLAALERAMNDLEDEREIMTKDHMRQPIVARDVVRQIKAGNRSIMGLMIESNIHAGNQRLSEDASKLAYGVSVTDPCIDWSMTVELLTEVAEELRETLPGRLRARADAA